MTLTIGTRKARGANHADLAQWRLICCAARGRLDRPSATARSQEPAVKHQGSDPAPIFGDAERPKPGKCSRVKEPGARVTILAMTWEALDIHPFQHPFPRSRSQGSIRVDWRSIAVRAAHRPLPYAVVHIEGTTAVLSMGGVNLSCSIQERGEFLREPRAPSKSF